MGINAMTELEQIKMHLIDKEELMLYKELDGGLYVVTITPQLSAYDETIHYASSVIGLYQQIYEFTREIDDRFEVQMNVMIQINDLYYVTGIIMSIEKLEDMDEFTFTSFDEVNKKNYNYLKPFSSF